MRTELFQPTVEGEARLLLLIERFSRGDDALEGRTKLAKLDFFLRYPAHFEQAMRIRHPQVSQTLTSSSSLDVETAMVRYRYGPWDPSYFALLGCLIGKELIVVVPIKKGTGYRATDRGREVAERLRNESAWQEVAARVDRLKKHLDLSGTTLKKFIYDNFPEVSQAVWGQTL